jgi:hypothetical protein
VRRSMGTMFALLGCLSTPLAAQSAGAGGSAWSLGLAATLGGGWQIEGADVGIVKFVHGGPVQALGLDARIGSFIDEGAIIGGTKGFVAALGVSARSGRLTIAEMGPENNTSILGIDLTLDLMGYLGSNSPLPQGGSWAAVSLLPGLRFGNAGGGQWSLVLGPTAFLGHPTDVHGFLGIRFESPLARRERRP